MTSRVFVCSAGIPRSHTIYLGWCSYMLSAITLGPNRVLVNYIKEMSADLGDLWIYKTVYSYPTPRELVQLMNIFRPEVVFLDIQSSEAATEVAKEIRSCYPKTAILGFSESADAAKVSKWTEAGVTELVAVPCAREDFQTAVGRAVGSQAAAVADNVVAFVPAKAGSGASTVLLHTAASLAQECHKEVLVLEGDVCSGTLGMQLGLDPLSSIVDALESSQWLSDSVWSRFTSQALGFDLLPMPVAKATGKLSRWEYQRLVTFARSRYDVILADLPETVDDAAEGLVAQASVVYLVATPEKPALFLARRRLDELKARGVSAERIRVVLNCCSWRKERIPEIEEFLGREIAAALPYDEAFASRTLADNPLVSRQSDLARAFRVFAGSLVGAEEMTLRTGAEQKTGLRSLFRF